MTRIKRVTQTLLGGTLLSVLALAGDWRNIENGWVIPSENYTDQPYVVVTNDGNWLCVMTTGRGKEGDSGQHIVSTISRDRGRTWSAPVDIEPSDGPEASWVVPLKVGSGRVYAIYTYNYRNIRTIPGSSARWAGRVDTLGALAFKYSDDHGRSWSRERYTIPTGSFRLDRENNFSGEIPFLWGVGKPIIDRGMAFYGFAKVSAWGGPGGAWSVSRGAILRSSNILTERDPRKITWELSPADDEGLRAPKGAIAEEPSMVALADGSLYCTYRTSDGYLCHAYSRDRARTWTAPEYATYAPGGRRMKHPRAAGFVWKTSGGKYLLWFHNNGGEPGFQPRAVPGSPRNPAWIAGGIERNGYLHWSEPEILIYSPDLRTSSISYPDFIEDGGRYFVTETQKIVARVHEIDRRLVEGLWSQFGEGGVAREGLALQVSPGSGKRIEMPALPDLRTGSGFSVELRVRLRELTAGQVLLNARDASGKGISLTTSDRGTIKLTLNDGQNESSWDSDPGVQAGTLRVESWMHIVVNVDAAAKIITFVVDGVLNDGGSVRSHGWGRFNASIGDVNGVRAVDLAPSLMGQLKTVRFYTRCLTTSEAVGNFKASRAERSK